jgi:hypothetical protein
MIAKAGLVLLAFLGLGCLGSAQPQASTPEGLLQQAKADAAAARWPQARTAAATYFATRCKHVTGNPNDCSGAQLIRGEAELALQAPESALLAFNWVLSKADDTSHDRAKQGLQRAKEQLQQLLSANADGTWLVVEQDFEDNHKFGPEEALYTLDGQELERVTRRSTFEEREHRVLARKIPSGPHRLAVEIHWRGLGTFEAYLWKSFNPREIEAPAGGLLVASLDVTYSDGGPSNNSIRQDFHLATYP